MAEVVRASRETGPVDASAADVKKPLTRAAKARADAAAVKIDLESKVIGSGESFRVKYPTGISIFVGTDVDEIEIGQDGVKSWIDAIDQHVVVPYGGTFRASTAEQLTNFRNLAAQGMLEPFYPVAEATA